MNISCTFRGRIAHITNIIPSQSSGNFYVVWVDDTTNVVSMTNIDVTELNSIGVSVTDTGIEELEDKVDFIYDEFNHETKIFPEDTDETVIFIAGGANNAWSNWTEIKDNNSKSFSDSFTSYRGHLSSIIAEQCSVQNKIYMFEIGYGSSKTIMTRGRVESSIAVIGFSIASTIRTAPMPVGETIYYRMKCETGAATLQVHFRYHYHG